MQTPKGTTGFTPTTDLIGGSPTAMLAYFLFNEGSQFLRDMRNPQNIDVDAATNALIAWCPGGMTKKEELWKSYKKRKDEGESSVTASIMVVGEMNSYLEDVMEFTTKATGGFG